MIDTSKLDIPAIGRHLAMIFALGVFAWSSVMHVAMLDALARAAIVFVAVYLLSYITGVLITRAVDEGERLRLEQAQRELEESRRESRLAEAGDKA